jgi:low affinity Fe/Cu permease
MASNHSASARSRLRSRLNLWFSEFAQAVSYRTGHPLTFLFAVITVVVWAISGPIFHYSEGWQLVINTGTTIVTFLMVFLIQNTQNRDILTLQLKLSEIVLAMKEAEDRFAAIEDLSDDELEDLHEECRARAEMTRSHLESRRGTRSKGANGDDGEPTAQRRTSNHGRKSKKTAAARSRH